VFEEVEVGGRLNAGENVLAAVVHHHGSEPWSDPSPAGFLLEMEVAADDHRQTLATDEVWKTHPAPYVDGYPAGFGPLGIPEDFDSAREPVGWTRAGFDDTSWAAAAVLGEAENSRWGELVPRDVPLQRFRTVAPGTMPQVNVVERDSGEQPDGLPAPGDAMARATRYIPALPDAVCAKHPAYFTVAPVQGERGISVVLDMGREVSGFPWIQVRSGGGGRVDLGYGERIRPDGMVLDGRYGWLPIPCADRFRMRPGPCKWTAFHPRVFRYLRLDFYDCPEPVQALVEVDTFGYPLERRGDFQCSDPLLTRIWEVARDTAEVCADDGWLNTPSGRGQSVAGVRVGALAGLYAFGDYKLARADWRRMLKTATVDQALDDQELPEAARALQPPLTTLNIGSLEFVSALWEQFLHTGDRALLAEAWPFVDQMLHHLKQWESSDGLLEDFPTGVDVDLRHVETRGQSTIVNALYHGALMSAARIARAQGNPNRGGDLEMRASEVADAINDLLWDQERGVYADAFREGKQSRAVSGHANLLCVLHGIAERVQSERVLAAFFDIGDSFPDEWVRALEPGFMLHAVRALCASDRHFEALRYLRTTYRAMLEEGATTTWEQAGGFGGWCSLKSASPAYLLPAYVAGIRPTQPGFEEFAVDLQPLGLGWMRCIVPTVRGEVRLSRHSASDGTAFLNLDVPKGTRAEVSLPVHSLQQPVVRLNGTVLYRDGALSPDAEPLNFVMEKERLRFSAPGGRYHLEVFRTPPGD
jgi:hypothetical protein